MVVSVRVPRKLKEEAERLGIDIRRVVEESLRRACHRGEEEEDSRSAERTSRCWRGSHRGRLGRGGQSFPPREGHGLIILDASALYPLAKLLYRDAVSDAWSPRSCSRKRQRYST
ncbi:hypothetical protein [Pyrodictium abyssi]|uniref:hypothetical protein n=1 Tax=Pyrodictium abyssi TaxID=54256 RepID=UPI0030C6723B